MTLAQTKKHIFFYENKNLHLGNSPRRNTSNNSPAPEPHGGRMGANDEGTQSHRKKVGHNMLNCANLIFKSANFFTIL